MGRRAGGAGLAKRAKKAGARSENGATVGYEAQLWQMAAKDYARPAPDKQEKATQTVLEQAALLSGAWAVA